MDCKYTNLQKELIENCIIPFIPQNKRGFTSKFSMCDIFKCIVYKLKTGCQLEFLFIDIESVNPPFSWQTVYYYYRKWCKHNVFQTMFLCYLEIQKDKLNTEQLNLDGTHSLVKKSAESAAYQYRKKAKTSNILILTDGNGIPIANGGIISGNHNDLFTRVLAQKRSDKNKIYSLHEPGVHCISKGKEHKKYEFGNKVSILYTQNTGVIVGALSFKNEYDGHTLPQALEQYQRLNDKPAKNVFADRGYKGKTIIGQTNIHIPKPFPKKLNPYQQQKRRKSHKRRAAIEPVIGHLKQDHRLSRNFYKGDFGDAINVMLAAAAFNFKRMMNKYKQKIAHIWLEIQAILFLNFLRKMSF